MSKSWRQAIDTAPQYGVCSLMPGYKICPCCEKKSKQCSSCRQYFVDGDIRLNFSDDGSRSDGLDHKCKTCRELKRPEGQSMHKLTESVKNANVGGTRESAVRLGDIPNKAKRRRAARDVHKARAKQAKAEALRKKGK